MAAYIIGETSLASFSLVRVESPQPMDIISHEPHMVPT